jgi:hypothetical protein
MTSFLIAVWLGIWGPIDQTHLNAAQEAKTASDWKWGDADPGATFATLLLVIIGAAQAGLFLWQLGLMRKGMLDAQKAADAAKEAANAAVRQAKVAEQSFAKLERPYLYITDVSSFKVDDKSSAEDPAIYVTYTVANYGKTPAIIKHAQGVCHGLDYRIANSPDFPLAFDYDHPLIAAPILKAGEVRERIREDGAANSVEFNFNDLAFIDETLDKAAPVNNVYQDVYLWIILTYRGPFTDHHEISACWRWEEGTRRFIKHSEHNHEK